jgi:peptide/nickel transport system substrate-binding protein
MSNQILSRREFLQAAAMAAAGAAVVACQPKTVVVKETVEVEKEKVVKEVVEVEKVVTATPVETEFTDPPVLAGLVQVGKLPPLEERLPTDLMVLEPLEKVGEYGGTLRSLYDVPSAKMMTIRGYEQTLRWSIDATTIEPNIAQAWEITDEGKGFTFSFRKGTKYHDGAPFTVDDIMFYFEDQLSNEVLSPTFPTWVAPGGEPVEVEKIDDFNIRFTFAAPHGFFLHHLAAQTDINRPVHYLKQFHADYAEKAELDKKTKEAQFDTWDQLYFNRADSYDWGNPDLPVIRAWYGTTEPPTTRYTFKRNPYYWKADPEGKQLPYIDECIISIVTDAEVLRLQILAGKSDLQHKRTTFDFYPLLKENEEAGGYRVLLWDNPRGACPALMPQLTVKDPALRELMADDRFRIALSHAINREQINEMVFHGMGEPRQATVATSSPIFKPEYARAYADYDPDKANALLDEIGLTDRGGDGFRLRPDGETLFILIEGPGEEPATTSQLELVKPMWEAVGVKTEIEESERGIYRDRVYSGEVTVGLWLLDYVYYPFNPVFTVPISRSTYWASTYGNWYATGGQAGEEPTGDIRKLQVIWDELQTVTDQEKQIEMFREIFDLHAEHCWLIGIVGHVPRPIVVDAKLRNIPEKAICSWTIMRYLGPARIEQLFFEE